MPLDATFVQKITEIAAPTTLTVDGKTFASKALTQVEAKWSELPSLISVVSLQGFTDLISNAVEKLVPEEWVVHVQNETTVALIKRVCDEHGRRLALIKAVPVATEGFRFGQYLPQETFIVGLGSRFVPGTETDLQYVIDLASGLTAGATRTSEDDGLTQKVTIKRGMALAKELQIKNRVKLAPYRTFPEVGQPISEFLLRLRGGDDDHLPELALFEADGGKWKLDAINEVRRYLATLNLKIPIIA